MLGIVPGMFTPEASVTSRVRVTVCDEEETSTVDGETERFENTGGSVSTELKTVTPEFDIPPNSFVSTVTRFPLVSFHNPPKR